MAESSFDREFPLRALPLWRSDLPGMIIGMSAGIGVGFYLGYQLLGLSPLDASLPAGLAFALGVPIWIGARALARRRQRPAIRLRGTSIFLPRPPVEALRVLGVPFYRGLVEIGLCDVRSFDVRTGILGHGFSITARKRTFLYWGVEAPGLREHLHEAIRTLPSGTQQLEMLLERERRNRVSLRRFPFVTLGVMGLLAAVYAVEVGLGATDNPLVLVDLGGNVAPLISRGQWHRLVSASVLHANFLHLLTNLVALLALGAMLELTTGSRRFAVLLLGSCLGGAAASALWRERPLSIGASTGLLGLLGALAVLNWRFRETLPPFAFATRRRWLLVLAASLAVAFWLPQLDDAAHLGGFLTGALLALALYPRSFEPEKRMSPAENGLLALLSLLFLLGLGLAFRNALDPPEADRLAVVRAFAAGSPPAADLNSFAWTLVTDPQASPEALQLALELASAAVEKAPDDPSYLDTLATARYRRGEYDAAVALERRVLAASPESVHATQLLRFLEARRRAGEPGAAGGTGQDLSIRVGPFNGGDAGQRALFVALPSRYPDGVAVYTRVKSRGEDLGLFWTLIGPEHAESHALVDSRDPTLSFLPKNVDFEVVLVDPSGCDCPPRSHRWWYRQLDPDTTALP